MVTLLLVEGQTPLEMVHCKTEAAPGVSPVTPELKSVGVVTTADPEVTVHAPVPGAGLFPARVVTRTLQRFCVAPALATGAGAASLMVTLLLVEGQTPLEMVHCSTEAAPGVSPVTPELNTVGEVTTAVPEVTVHAPVPGAGLLPARVVTRTLQRFCVAPALATGAGAASLMVTLLLVEGQTPLEMVHSRTDAAPGVSPVTPELNTVGEVTTAEPEVTVQAPVPGAGLLPARVVTRTLQRFCVAPALATGAGAASLMVTLLLVEGQTPLEMVHSRTEAAPGVSPVTPELNTVGEVTTADPEVTVHAPVPGAGLLPARVVTRTLQRFCVAPAMVTGAESA